jgi:hypothetical protein
LAIGTATTAASKYTSAFSNKLVSMPLPVGWLMLDLDAVQVPGLLTEAD